RWLPRCVSVHHPPVFSPTASQCRDPHTLGELVQVARTARQPARLVVLVSGAGSNLAALLEAVGSGDLAADVVAVGADRHDAGGLRIAADAGVPTFVEAVAD